ncbi:hypothetical protein ZWY2020_039912 [Hordeum vulgare]|nr:hypothetical protein ZWY2020_039912 [Hordeum vulgare]
MVSGGGQAQPPSSAPAAEYGSRLPQMVDREGAKLHGEIMLLFVAVFAFLFTCVFFFLWLRRRTAGADRKMVQDFRSKRPISSAG